MSDLDKVFDLKNLRRAYRWILSNPDPRYKNYFRDSYAAFAIASETELKLIKKKGISHRFTPSHASKIMIPKPSGTLRPITLLTIEDQIVYQAYVNVIADLLKPKTKHRYRKRVYAHLYAGKSAPFFYMKWQDSYRLMGRCIKDLFSKGFVHVANFDLAAFYDSIDHHVLNYFLKDVGLDEDAIDLLLRCLRQWTSSTWNVGSKTIYHQHGIPQGPLSSGMLSELILQHIDKAGERGRKTRYIRYVDDIKIFAKTEAELRQKLIALDLSSKEIGLFPQTSKINIRQMTDPNDEIKSVSQPPEPSITPRINQQELIIRILKITRRGRVDSVLSTRFKYLLAKAEPNYRINKRIITVLKNHPEYSEYISLYISKYRKIPTKLAHEIITYIESAELYHSVNGDLLRACLGHMPPTEENQLGTYCANRLLRPRRGSLLPQPTYKEALIAWALGASTISYAELETLRDSETDWWVRKSILRELTEDQFGTASYRQFLNDAIRVKESEVSRVAAVKLIEEEIPLDKPYGDVFESAKIILKTAKIIRSYGKPPSMINSIISYILSRPETPYDWIKFFRGDHKQAELMAIFLKQSRESDIDAFITRFDSFADMIVKELFKRHCPGKTYPPYGSALKNPTLVALLPLLMKVFGGLHDLRLQSVTAHPRSFKTGKGTRRLKHYDFRKIRPGLIAAFDVLETVITP